MRPTDLRGILQYIPQFREKTFILAIDGGIVTDDNFATLLLDVALLWSLNIRVVLVHGAAAQISQARRRPQASPPRISMAAASPMRPTLELALTAANRLTHEILEGLSANDLRAASTNVIIAHPLGVIQGVDHLFTGQGRARRRRAAPVARSPRASSRSSRRSGSTATARPTASTPTAWRSRSRTQLKAVKLIFVTAQRRARSTAGSSMRQMLVGELSALLQQDRGGFAPDMLSKAQHAVRGCKAGVPRVHVIDGTLDEGLLGEVFSNHGLGTLIHANEYEHIRPAQKKDVRAIQMLTEQARRSRRTAQADAERRSSSSSATTTSSRSTRIRWPASRCTSIPRQPGRAGVPLRQRVAREPGHRPQADPVRRESRARHGPAATAGAVDAGVHVLPVQGRLRRRHARRPAAARREKYEQSRRNSKVLLKRLA